MDDPPTRDDLVRWYHEEGMTQGEIAELLDVPRNAVWGAFCVLEIETRNGSGRYRTDITPEECAELYRDGLTISEIAERKSAADETIRARLREADVEVQSRQFNVEEVRAIRRKYDEGNCTLEDLGEEYGTSRQNIWLVVNGETYADVDGGQGVSSE